MRQYSRTGSTSTCTGGERYLTIDLVEPLPDGTHPARRGPSRGRSRCRTREPLVEARVKPSQAARGLHVDDALGELIQEKEQLVILCANLEEALERAGARLG